MPIGMGVNSSSASLVLGQVVSIAKLELVGILSLLNTIITGALSPVAFVRGACMSIITIAMIKKVKKII